MRNQSYRLVVAVALLLLLPLAFGCASSGSKKKASKERKRTVLLTSHDDMIAGAEAAKSVEVDIGLLDDEALTEYVQSIGKKLLRGLPRRDFAFHFSIVDQMEPNAFALPGGHIFVSRGLLALVNNVDELACVLGHEIIHSARRHSAQQQEVARNSPISFPMSRAATLAAYGRDMEREADALGQQLCAAAGYNPMGMSTFMRSLDQRERLLIGHPRAPTFLDTHPGTQERASINSARASEMRWTRGPYLTDPRAIHLDAIDGMVIGDRPESGVFADELFIHPVLGFEMRFPRGWQLRNSNRAVGAVSPRGDAAVFLSGDVPEGELVEVADNFAKEASEKFGVRLTEKHRAKVGGVDAVRYAFEGSGRTFGLSAMVTFFPFAGSNWRIVGLSPTAAGNRFAGPILLSTRSFGPLTESIRLLIETDRLRVVLARSGEDLVAFGERTETTLPPAGTALLNGMLGNEVFEGGELMKIIRREN
jgi:predicted Zn-dependent protease